MAARRGGLPRRAGSCSPRHATLREGGGQSAMRRVTKLVFGCAKTNTYEDIKSPLGFKKAANRSLPRD